MYPKKTQLISELNCFEDGKIYCYSYIYLNRTFLSYELRFVIKKNLKGLTRYLAYSLFSLMIVFSFNFCPSFSFHPLEGSIIPLNIRMIVDEGSVEKLGTLIQTMSAPAIVENEIRVSRISSVSKVNLSQSLDSLAMISLSPSRIKRLSTTFTQAANRLSHHLSFHVSAVGRNFSGNIHQGKVLLQSNVDPFAGFGVNNLIEVIQKVFLDETKVNKELFEENISVWSNPDFLAPKGTVVINENHPIKPIPDMVSKTIKKLAQQGSFYT